MAEPTTKEDGDWITSAWANSLLTLMANRVPPNYTVYAEGGKYYAKDNMTSGNNYDGTSYADVIQAAIDDTTMASGGVVYVKSPGTFTKYVRITDNVQVVGNGPYTRLAKATNYSGGMGAFFNLEGSNSKLTNLWLQGYPGSTTEKLVTVNPNAVNIENVKIRDVYVQSYWQGIIAASTGAGLCTNVEIDNCTVDHSGAAAFGFGPGMTVARLTNSRAIEPGHTGVDVWGCDRYVLVENCEILKSVNTLGAGIAVTSIPDDLPEHDTQEVILRNNRIKGAIQYDGIVVYLHGDHVVVDGNMIDGATRNGISVTCMNIGGTDYYGKNVSIINNDVRNVGSKPGNGIFVMADGVEATVNENIIANNRVLNVGVYGIEVYNAFRCAVTGNSVYLPARTTANSSGICLYDVRRCTATGNTIYGDASVDYGIEEAGIADYNAIVGNVSNKPHLIIGANTQNGHNV